ncbi:MerR family transcriptional regulator [Streptomyces lavendulocolor]|uniref:MerR family transcriptional regulator n=1 Tax=Streptomyces lavendulocolor TaxID=67316 RepID=UPI003C2D8D20
MRSGAGQRHYSDAAVLRVSLIRQLFDAGMSSRVIATVLPWVDVPGDLSVAEETFTVLMRERDRVDADIAHLVETWNASTCCSSQQSAPGWFELARVNCLNGPKGASMALAGTRRKAPYRVRHPGEPTEGIQRFHRQA